MDIYKMIIALSFLFFRNVEVLIKWIMVLINNCLLLKTMNKFSKELIYNIQINLLVNIFFKQESYA